ncbi:MAG: hypothetical protein A3C88_00890 [Candidatus Yanofskybacteria bacterium RIFCSPHIGHO2_02_FULL_50_12]|uniref:Outer membrane protein beta-barrel domain-containing protein n=1 Tax=Candidatus Yanofskybacteria bacterium RIFCSPHIGHO2_02_FULL_50_12 TaxID=1802685 RepID=A0A1F8FTG1_9BACT|nr:MAG: hypothetical protein A3C88_00890 [Candidatus Yanofskybacteria bacterium RIFCSPHIGHO2_02_FULL_50_12]
MRHFFITLVAVVFLSASIPANAQVSGETEALTNGKGGSHVSQYVFYDWNTVNLVTRYFWVNNAVNQFEFGLGPTLKVHNTTLKLQFGGTTERSLMAAGVLLRQIAGRQLIYVADFKISTTEIPSELFQEASFAIDQNSVWQLHAEWLHLSRELVFLRLGGEYQLRFDSKRHLYIAPFYDPIVSSPGAMIGFRFF